jgi:quercetin dioxygenase-like cupin family protein
MPAPTKSLPEFSALTGLGALGALTSTEQRQLAGLGKSAKTRARTAAALYRELPLLLAASTPARRPRPTLKEEILQRTVKNAPSKLVPARHVGFFAYAADSSAWRNHAVPGVRYRTLTASLESNYDLMLFQLAPGAIFPEHKHAGGDEECYVLAGDFHVDGQVLHAGDFHHADKGTDHGVSTTEAGCTLLIVAPHEDYGA